jgi:hypothetical protein
MADAFIRAQNARPHRFASPVVALTTADERGVINEAGFLLFKQIVSSVAAAGQNEDAITRSLEAAILRNERFPHPRRSNLDAKSVFARQEVRAIARNLQTFFPEETAPVYVNPPLPGCGWVSDAEADILCGTTLYEVKAGDRHFRLADLRQLLTYCALNFSSRTYDIRNVALINPRSGILVRESLDTLCRQISGAPSVRVLAEIVAFVSEPTSTYFMT